MLPAAGPGVLGAIQRWSGKSRWGSATLQCLSVTMSLCTMQVFFGMQSGHGLAMAKLASGEWSAPAVFNWGAAEAGPTLGEPPICNGEPAGQIDLVGRKSASRRRPRCAGLSHIYSVLVLNTEEALKQFTSSGAKFKFGAGLEVDYLTTKSLSQAQGWRLLHRLVPC